MTELGGRGHEAAAVAPPAQPIDAIIVGGDELIDATVNQGLELQVRSQWSYARMRFLRHRLAMAGLVGLVIVFGAGAFAGTVAPYSFDQIDLNHLYAPPTLAANHFFGTDQLGRDFFSRTIYG